MENNKGLVLIVILLFTGLIITPSINAKFDIATNEILNLNNGNHPPIYINGNDDFTPQNGVTGGNGTENDPYIIEDWVIADNSSTENGIFINNTDVYFVIRNCSVYNYSELAHGKGILLSHVENGRIESTTTYGNYYGIMVRDNSKYIEINNCSSGYSDGWNSRGIICIESSRITITSSKVHDTDHGVLLSDTPYVIIENSSIYNCFTFKGIWITGQETAHDYIIKDCRIYNNGYGISISLHKKFNKQPGNVHISNCEIYNHRYSNPNVSSDNSAIHITGLHGNIIENCNIHDNTHGIGLTWSTDNIIRNCSIFNHTTNSAFGSMGIDIYNLALLPLPKGWLVGNRIFNCDIYSNDIGLVAETGKTVVQKNNFYNNGLAGIWTLFFSKVHLNYNNIYGNGYLELGDGVKITRLSYADLRNNWWGSSNGPKTMFHNGGGDTLYRFFSIAQFRPWATEPIPDAGVN